METGLREVDGVDKFPIGEKNFLYSKIFRRDLEPFNSPINLLTPKFYI